MFYYRAVFLGVVALCVGVLALANVVFIYVLFLSEAGSVTVVVPDVWHLDVEHVTATIAEHYGAADHSVRTDEDGSFATVTVEVRGTVDGLEAAGAPPYGTVEKSRLGPDGGGLLHMLALNVPPLVVLAVGMAVLYPRARRLDSRGRRP